LNHTRFGLNPSYCSKKTGFTTAR